MSSKTACLSWGMCLPPAISRAPQNSSVCSSAVCTRLATDTCTFPLASFSNFAQWKFICHIHQVFCGLYIVLQLVSVIPKTYIFSISFLGLLKQGTISWWFEQEFVLSQLLGWKSKIQVLVGYVFPEVYRGEFFLVPFQLLMAASHPWHSLLVCTLGSVSTPPSHNCHRCVSDFPVKGLTSGDTGLFWARPTGWNLAQCNYKGSW